MSCFALSLPFGSSSLSLGVLFPPLASPLCFLRTSLTKSRWLQRFAPRRPCPRPASTRTSTSLRASCQARSLPVGLRLLPFGGLCQRGVEMQVATPSCPMNTLLKVRWLCVTAPSLSMSLSPSFHDCPSTRTHAPASLRSLSCSLSWSLHCERVTHSLAMQFVQSVGLMECALPCGHAQI